MSPVHAAVLAPPSPPVRVAERSFTVAACAVQHRGDRPEQQDRVAILRSRHATRSVLGLLADGVGGRSGGALAASQVIATAQRRFDTFQDEGDPQRFFLDLVAELHVVLQIAGATAALDPHSTLAAVMVSPERVDWCHVGDSRVYHLRNGRVRQRTTDDTYSEQLIRTGRASEDRARLHPAGDRLTQVLGGAREPTPSISTLYSPRAGDSFLLASDGAWRDLSDVDIAQAIVAGTAPRDALGTLLEQARTRAHGQGDNCSMVLLSLVAAGPAKSA